MRARSGLWRIVAAAVCLGSICACAPAALRSPMPSGVPGFTIPNVHGLAGTGPGLGLRGQAPRRDEIPQLRTYGITDILIFKKQETKEVDREIGWLLAAGYQRDRIHTIPFPWKDMGAFRDNCALTVRALRLLRDLRADGSRGVYLHCTVGEDRTGYLAGLFRMLVDGWDEEQAFRRELCAHGFGDGNTAKPEWVKKAVLKELSPLYSRMAKLISSGRLKLDSLDEAVCDTEPEKTGTPPAGDRCY